MTPGTAIGLFAGIGGFEKGLSTAGFESSLLCDNAPSAQAVLARHFPAARIHGDIRTLRKLPPADVVLAGFPCTDLSQAGRLAGIRGPESGLVDHVFRLLRDGPMPRWLVLETVPFLLRLDGGAGMHFLVKQLEALGLRWAYRTIDARAFGAPQRRQRVVVVASRSDDPRGVLFADDAGPPADQLRGDLAGFYWTEGTRGVGWVPEGIPPLKVSSGLGIPSPPAIWDRAAGDFFTPDVRDAERLQGFPSAWTKPAGHVRHRWKLVGNAVSVGMSRWLGRRLTAPRTVDAEARLLAPDAKWPRAAWGQGDRFEVDVSEWPVRWRQRSLSEFLRYERHPLSLRAAKGFLGRARNSRLRFEAGFLDALDAYVCRAGG